MKTKISTHRKKVILDVIKGANGSDGRTKWNADIMMDLFLLIRAEYNLKQEDIRMMDHTLLSLVVDGNDEDTNHIKNIKTMKDIMSGTRLLMIPILHRGKWSLIVYTRDWKKWYICATTRGGDGDLLRIMEVMHSLYRLGMIQPRTTMVRTYDNLPIPECGIHCLYYAFIHIHNYGLVEAGNIEEFEREVGLMICPEKEITGFMEGLKKLLLGE